MLTDAQEQQIESVENYTHDYEAEAMQSLDATGDDLMSELQDRFEDESVLLFDSSEDLGGMTVYFSGRELVAFYDYERFKGVVFDTAEA